MAGTVQQPHPVFFIRVVRRFPHLRPRFTELAIKQPLLVRTFLLWLADGEVDHLRFFHKLHQDLAEAGLTAGASFDLMVGMAMHGLRGPLAMDVYSRLCAHDALKYRLLVLGLEGHAVQIGQLRAHLAKDVPVNFDRLKMEVLVGVATSGHAAYHLRAANLGALKI